jgi:hypothetical protein
MESNTSNWCFSLDRGIGPITDCTQANRSSPDGSAFQIKSSTSGEKSGPSARGHSGGNCSRSSVTGQECALRRNTLEKIYGKSCRCRVHPEIRNEAAAHPKLLKQLVSAEESNLQPTDCLAQTENKWFQRFPGCPDGHKWAVLGHGFYEICYVVNGLCVRSESIWEFLRYLLPGANMPIFNFLSASLRMSRRIFPSKCCLLSCSRIRQASQLHRRREYPVP